MHRLLLLLLLSLLSAQVYATVLWDESVDGDLNGLGHTIGPLQIGTNTFIGTAALFRENGNLTRADTDSGFVELLEGLRITSMESIITSEYGYGVISSNRITGMHSPTIPQIYYKDMSADITYDYLLPSDEIGTYRFYTGGGGASVLDNIEYFWDWRIDIEVRQIPEPSALALFSLGLIGFGYTRRKP